MKSNTGQIDNKTSTCIISQLKPLSRPPSVGDRIGVITKNKFFHFGQYASFDDEGDSIYLKNGALYFYFNYLTKHTEHNVFVCRLFSY